MSEIEQPVVILQGGLDDLRRAAEALERAGIQAAIARPEQKSGGS